MDMDSYIEKMPKAELGLVLEGAVRKQTWLTLAEENEVASENRKAFVSMRTLLEESGASHLDELVQGLVSWLRYPDDLTRIVYDVGVTLAKQNVRYAEIAINPSLFMFHGMSFDEMMSALNDGRDRVERGWKVQIRWNLVVARSEPRRADDIVRWATSATGRKHGIVGYGLVGKEDAQPIGQFERSFQNAAKKELPTFVRAGETLGAEGVFEALSNLHPQRLMDGLGLVNHPEALQYVRENDIPVLVDLRRVAYLGLPQEDNIDPFEALMSHKLGVVLSVDMPEIYGANLTEAYRETLQAIGNDIEKLNEVALNALHYSFVDVDTKARLIDEFQQSYQDLVASLQAAEL